MALFLGIDGGGTGCRAALADAGGSICGRGRGGAANIVTNLFHARDSIVGAAREAFAQAGIPFERAHEATAVLGLAGANVGAYGKELAELLPFGRARVENDALTALEGAVGPGNGAIAIIGTGTAFMVRHEGQTRAIGGWGFAVGDRGSGARMGQKLLEETLLAHDAIRAPSPLSGKVMRHFRDNPQAVVEWATKARPGDFGGFAPWLFEQPEDPLARDIIALAAADLAAAIRALQLREGDRLCLLGGLAPLMESRLPADCRSFVRPPQGDAVDGALALARLWAAEQGGQHP